MHFFPKPLELLRPGRSRPLQIFPKLLKAYLRRFPQIFCLGGRSGKTYFPVLGSRIPYFRFFSPIAWFWPLICPILLRLFQLYIF